MIFCWQSQFLIRCQKPSEKKKIKHGDSFLNVHQNKWSEKSPIYSHHLRLETRARDVVRVFVSQSCSMNRERETRVAGHSIHTFYHQAISQPFIAVLVTRYAYLRSEIPNPGVHFYPVCSSFLRNHRSTVSGHKRKLSPSGGNARQVEIACWQWMLLVFVSQVHSLANACILVCLLAKMVCVCVWKREREREVEKKKKARDDRCTVVHYLAHTMKCLSAAQVWVWLLMSFLIYYFFTFSFSWHPPHLRVCDHLITVIHPTWVEGE